MIGLMTFQNADNYGAVLQAYALQKKVDDIGCDNEYIDFEYNMSKSYNGSVVKNTPEKFKKLFHPIKLMRRRIRSSGFKKFRENYLRISRHHYSGDCEIRTCRKYDRYIVGSDQVWNFDITNQSHAFLLDFVADSIPKYSYASSFGKSALSESEKSIFKYELNRFNSISVREAVGAELIHELSDKPVSICLDPSMLLLKSEWEGIAVKPYKKKYVLIYAMTDTPGITDFARGLSKQMNTGIVAIGLKKKYPGIKNIYAVSPEQWLGYIANAEATVTNSFHGTVFSILFKKSVYIEYLPSGWTVNSRLEDIVRLFGLENRIIKNDIAFSEMNYEKIDRILAEKRLQSLKYLKGICTQNEQN